MMIVVPDYTKEQTPYESPIYFVKNYERAWDANQSTFIKEEKKKCCAT